MFGPRRQLRQVAIVCGVLGLLALVEPATAQELGTTETGAQPAVEVAGAMGLTLIIGGLLVALAPDFTEGVTSTMRSRAVSSFFVGLGILALLIVLIFVGWPASAVLMIPAVPLLVMISPLGGIALGRAFKLSWGGSLLLSVVFAGVASVVPVVGPIVAFILEAAAIGGYFFYLTSGSDTQRSDRQPT